MPSTPPSSPQVESPPQQGYYQLWSSGDYSTQCMSSQSSPLSSSPTSSIDSIVYNEPRIVPRRKELPSAKACVASANFLATSFKHSNLNVTCAFCKNNGEPHHIYTSHLMKNAKGKVTCPLLKIYVCPICGETGDSAHTITYCKKYKLLKRNNLITNSMKSQ